MSSRADKNREGGAGTSGGTMPPQTVVAIRVPARAEYVVILRAACGQVAPLLGCSLDEIADLGLAVDEAIGFLLRNCVAVSRGAEQNELSATFVVTEPGLHITLSMAADVAIPPDGGDFGWAILTALVDDFSWCVQDATVRVDIRKKRMSGVR